MSWGMVGAAAVTVIGGSIASKKASKAASSAADATADATTEAARIAAEANDKSIALMKEGYSDASRRLSPFIASEAAANRQLMAQMGLTPDYSSEIRDYSSQIRDYTEQIEGLNSQVANLRNTELEALTGQDANRISYLRNRLGSGEIFERDDASLPFLSHTSDTYNDESLVNVSGRLQNELDELLARNPRDQSRLSPESQQEIAELESRIASYEDRVSQAQQVIDSRQGDQQPEVASTAYLDLPSYKGAVTEGVSAVNQGAATSGSLYSGARGEALKDVGQSVQQTYYNNYMNILQGMANPASTTNLSNMGIGSAASMGNVNAATASQINASNLAGVGQSNAYNLQGTQAQNAAIADIAGGVSSGVSAYMNRPQSNEPDSRLSPVWT